MSIQFIASLSFASLLPVPEDVKQKVEKEMKLKKLYDGVLYYVCKGLEDVATRQLPQGNEGHGELQRCRWENPKNPLEGVSYMMKVRHHHIWKKFGKEVTAYSLHVDSRGVLQPDPDFLGRHNICVKSPVGRICVSTLTIGYLNNVRSLFEKIQNLKNAQL